jgi:O-acetyl-ADP-ribose deacetylase (regulator of RNase III)
MITIKHGNIFEAKVEALVNTVNCIGIMGKGLALQFKKAYPENFDAYERACKADEVQPGRMFIFKYSRGEEYSKKYIINFPTKSHWALKSHYKYIEIGLEALVADVQRLGIKSIAIPPLGCGLGGLDWSRVRPMIEQAFKLIPDVEVHLYESMGA